jgi:NTP pyrophosphatase (non-canonical NTP hydrolase)
VDKFKTIVSRIDDIKQLVAKKWHDDYLLKLAISDHVDEVVALRDKVRKHKSGDYQQEFDKELMDLFILLLMWSVDEGDLFSKRVDKFLLHLKNNDLCGVPGAIDVLKNQAVLRAVTSVYGEQRMDEYIKAGFVDLCLQQRKLRLAEERVSQNDREKV